MAKPCSVYQLHQNLDHDSRFDGFTFWKDRVAPSFAEAYEVFGVNDGMLTSWTPRQPKEEWKALPVVGKVSPLHDYPCLNLLIPVFSRRATDTLGTMLTENGMLLALSTDVGEYFGFICMTKLNALDLQKTRLRRKNPNERSDAIEHYAFNPSVLTNATIFRIPEQPNTYFVTNVFHPFYSRMHARFHCRCNHTAQL